MELGSFLGFLERVPTGDNEAFGQGVAGVCHGDGGGAEQCRHYNLL